MELKNNTGKKLDEYNGELQNAINQLKGVLSQAQVTMGVIESFIYLVRKESKEIEHHNISSNGEVK